jgi:cell division protein FtsB
MANHEFIVECLSNHIRADAEQVLPCAETCIVNQSLTWTPLSCGMVIFRRLRATLYPLLLYCLSGTIGTYFVWHAVNGERGLKTKDEYERKIAALTSELDGLKAEHARWNHRIALLSGRVIDRDLLDEEARAVLGRVRRDELVVLYPRAQNPPHE